MKAEVQEVFELCLLDRTLIEDVSLNTYYENKMIVKDQTRFDKAFNKFMSLKKIQYFSQKMVLFTISRTLLNCKDLDDSNINDRVILFTKYLNDFERKEYKVVKTFHGVKMENSENPISFDPLIIYSLPRHNNKIKSLFTMNHEYKIFNDNHEKTVIECRVEACDHWKAQELANVIYNNFELLVAFLLAEKYISFSFGINRMNFTPYQSAIVSCSGGIFSGEKEGRHSHDNLEISNLLDFLPKEYTRFFKLLYGIVLSPQTVLDKKISSSVEWVGQSYTDTNSASAYLKAVIALEALLKTDEKGVVTPSIMSSIAEQCAHLNGNTTSECMAIEKKVKAIYAERSKIAHTGSSTVSTESLRDTRDFVRTTILKFVSFKEDLKWDKPEQFQMLIRKNKYSTGGLGI